MNERPSMKLNPDSTASATTTAAAATRFPDIYRNPIWGRHTYPADDIPATIIANRNKLVEKFHLVRNIRAPSHQTSFEGGFSFDHVEAYKDSAGWIWAICGLYGGAKPPSVLEMKPTAPLHSASASSFIGRFSGIKDLRARLEAAASGSGGEKFSAARHLFTEPPTPRRSRLQGRGKATT